MSIDCCSIFLDPIEMSTLQRLCRPLLEASLRALFSRAHKFADHACIDTIRPDKVDNVDNGVINGVARKLKDSENTMTRKLKDSENTMKCYQDEQFQALRTSITQTQDQVKAMQTTLEHSIAQTQDQVAQILDMLQTKPAAGSAE